jgi:large subunit ribosomal protein L9
MPNVILTKQVRNLGAAGEVVRVRPGFARNYLIPQGIAMAATAQNIAQLETRKRQEAAAAAASRAEFEKLASVLRDTSVSISRRKGSDERLFGSVNSKDIVDALASKGITLDRHYIHLASPIKTAGSHSVDVRFASDLAVKVKVEVSAV